MKRNNDSMKIIMTKTAIILIVLIILCLEASYGETNNYFQVLKEATAKSNEKKWDEATALSGNLKQGTYKVGLKVIQTFDYSRAYTGKQGRPMQVVVWYPTSTASPKMEYAEYLNLYLTEEDFAAPSEKQRQENLAFWEKELAGSLNSSIDTKAIFQAKTNAIKDAIFAKGYFPVIIYGAGGMGESFENSVLCEYLASYGYIVLASPSVGPFEHKTTINALGLEAEARDMEFLIAQSHNFPEADLSKLGLMGWSWGGLSAMLVQMRNPKVDAVVSLDGAIASHEDKLNKTAFADTNRIRIPVMYMTVQETNSRVKNFIERVNYSNSLILDFSEFTHSDFSSYNFIVRNFAPSLNDSEKKKQQIYEIVCDYTLRFFEAQLKDDSKSREFLSKDSAQKELLTVSRNSALPLPPTQADFFGIIKEKGFESAYKIYQEVKARDANYQIFEAFEITVVADQLFKAGKAEDAIKCAKLRIEAYPNDYLSYEWLANLYYKQKDWTNALHFYGMAYGMALKEKETAELLEELNWYQKRIETVKKNMSETPK